MSIREIESLKWKVIRDADLVCRSSCFTIKRNFIIDDYGILAKRVERLRKSLSLLHEAWNPDGRTP